MEEGQALLDGKTFDEYSKALLSTLIQATRLSNQLPDSEEYSYYTTYPTFPSRMKNLGASLLNRGQQLISHTAGTESSLTKIDPQIDDLNDKFNSDVVEALDVLLEQVDWYLDTKGHETDKTSLVAKTIHFREKGNKDREIIHAKNILRPQEAWRHRVDNSYGAFIPKITSKPHARQPLDEVFAKKQPDLAVASNTKSVSKAMEMHLLNVHKNVDSTHLIKYVFATIYLIPSYPHPYEYELQNYVPLPEQLLPCKETLYRPLEETPLNWITTPEQVHSLVAVLKKQSEFAVDLEHHSYRTYQGFTCLIQISTRQEDYLIDPLVLMDHLEIMNEVFADPNIVKVLHGADMDIQWLQRDFGIYIVNMFDTGQASRVLEMPSHRLSSLLSHFCNINVDKKYQLADWRIRPLPTEMEKYAREDTHYLLYVYDRLRNEAITRGNEANNLLMAILHRSRDVCLSLYVKEHIGPESYMDLYEKIGDVLSEQQLRVFAALFFWRDRTAREEDESVRYVLPDKMLFNIAKNMPSDTNQLLICCTPTPPLLRVHASDVILIVQDAMDNVPQILPKPILNQASTTAPETPQKPTQKVPIAPAVQLPIQLRKSGKRESVSVKLSKDNSNYSSAYGILFGSDEESLDEEQVSLVESIKGSISTDFFSMRKEFPTEQVTETEKETEKETESTPVVAMETEEETIKPEEKVVPTTVDKKQKEYKSITETYNIKASSSTFKTKQQLKREREAANAVTNENQKRRKQ